MDSHHHCLEWEYWNSIGFFPGQEENETTFAERVAYCKNLRTHLNPAEGIDIPFDLTDTTSKQFIEKILPKTDELFGIKPLWVPLFFSNYQLLPWHGGCAWIFQINQNSPTAAFLQLRARFLSSPTYLGIYHRDELICHELAHVGRMVYQEPKYEEFFAYQSSPSTWRRYFGPIVQSSNETLLFILILGLMVMIDFALLASGSAISSDIGWTVKITAIAIAATAFGRLIYRHTILNRCLKNLIALYGSNRAPHFLYRLLDNEIDLFSKLTPDEIISFIEDAKQRSFRWRFLSYLYIRT